MLNTDFDPYQTLIDLSANHQRSSELARATVEVVNDHAKNIVELSEYIYSLNQRLCDLENQIIWLTEQLQKQNPQ